MRRRTAAIGAAIFFAIAPGTVVGLVPCWITGWRATQPEFPTWVQVVGVVLLAIGAPVLIHAFARFVVEGLGTPAPIAPTSRLVVGGFYRHVRNPMYLAVTACILGQALILSSADLLVYAGIVLGAFMAFVLGYEQPTLRRQFGAEYDTYRRNVAGWLPRLRPGDPPAVTACKTARQPRPAAESASATPARATPARKGAPASGSQ